MRFFLAFALVSISMLPFSLVATPGSAPAPAATPKTFELDGLIVPYLEINISPGVDGLIEKVLVDRGDLVEKGQVLAELESSVEKAAVEVSQARSELVAAIKSGEARLKLSEQRLKKDTELLKSNIVSPDEFEQRETECELAKMGLLEAKENRLLAELDCRRAKAALELRSVKSPVRGVVVERSMSPGELVNRNGQVIIFKLAQIDPLRVEVIAPVAWLGKVQVGETAEVIPEEPIGGVHTAKVTVVDRVVDAGSGTFGIRLELSNVDYELPAGLKCRVRFHPEGNR